MSVTLHLTRKELIQCGDEFLFAFYAQFEDSELDREEFLLCVLSDQEVLAELEDTE